MTTTTAPSSPATIQPARMISERYVRDLMLEVLAAVDAPDLLLTQVDEGVWCTANIAIQQAHSRMRFLRDPSRFAGVVEDCVYHLTRDLKLAFEARLAYDKAMASQRDR